MKWNGRQYRPANAQFITKKKPFDFQEALKPYGDKEMPVWSAIVGVNNEVSSTPVPDVTPSPTPSNTPTSTSTPTPTLTPSPTRSLFTYLLTDCLTGDPYFGNYPSSSLVYGNVVKSAVNNRCYSVDSSYEFSPSANTLTFGTYTICNDCTGITPTPTGTPQPTPTPTLTPSPIPSGTTLANEFLARVVATGGTLNSTISAATQTMFNSLVSTGLWEDISVFYPIIGGVANAHSQAAGQQYNSSFNGTFNGGVTHSSSGMTFNGVNGYMDTNWAITNQLGSTSLVSIGGYTNTSYVESLMGCLNGDASTIIQLRLDVPSGQIAPNPATSLAGALTTSMTGSSGTFITSRTGTTATFVLQNNVVTNLTQASGLTDADRTMWVGARNYGGSPAYGTGRVAFVFMGKTLTEAKAITLKGIIQTFQTSLSRQV